MEPIRAPFYFLVHLNNRFIIDFKRVIDIVTIFRQRCLNELLHGLAEICCDDLLSCKHLIHDREFIFSDFRQRPLKLFFLIRGRAAIKICKVYTTSMRRIHSKNGRCTDTDLQAKVRGIKDELIFVP